MKATGFGSIYKQATSRFWWVKFYAHGKCVRKSTGCELKKDAESYLRQLQGQITSGKYDPLAEKTSFEDLATIVVTDYRANGRKAIGWVEVALKPLREFFGASLAKDITYDRLSAYVAARLEKGRAPATARNELAVLKRAFHLAEKAGKAKCPPFPTITVQNARKGFVERADFEKVLSFLPENLRPICEFMYMTGWRLGEVVPLRWNQVDFRAGVVRLEVGETKNSEGRVLPFDALPALERLLRVEWTRTKEVELRQGRVIPHVFHRDGEPVKDFRGAWDAACEKAGVPGLLRHDLRRSAVRNLERASVARSVATRITGHRTESVYRRYAIANENDLREGLRKLARLHAAEEGQAAPGHILGISAAQ